MCFGGEAEDIAEQERHRAAAEALTEACASVATACIAAGGTLNGFELTLTDGGVDVGRADAGGRANQCSISSCTPDPDGNDDPLDGDLPERK